MTAARRVEWRRERGRLGLCVDCPNPVEPGRARCAACLERNRDSRRGWKEHTSVRADLEAASKVARCPCCSLMLPHDGCLPPIEAYASSRRGDSTGTLAAKL